MILPSWTITAPIGTSFRFDASSASRIADSIQRSSSVGLVILACTIVVEQYRKEFLRVQPGRMLQEWVAFRIMRASTMRSIRLLVAAFILTGRSVKRLSGILLLVALPLVARCGDTTAVTNTVAAEKSRAVAVALSLLMPGAGQLYNGQQGKAALHFGLFAGSVTWVVLRDIGPTNADIKPMDWLSVVCVGVTYVWAAVDAAVDAGGGGES